MKIPDGWKQRGSLPTEETFESTISCQEALWSLESPDGYIVIDLSWYPDYANEGDFVLRVIHDADDPNNWLHPMFRWVIGDAHFDRLQAKLNEIFPETS